jgi:hypothetical protein
MTDVTADVLAIKAVIAVLISELDDDARGEFCDAASDVIRNYTLHDDDVKQGAIASIANMMDKAA